MTSYAGYLVQTLVTLVAVCGVAIGVLYGARRLGIGRPRGPVTLVGQLPLEGRRAIYLVRVGPQVLIVGASEAGLVRLGEVDAAAVDASVAEAVAADRKVTFADMLARARTDGSGQADTETRAATDARREVEGRSSAKARSGAEA